MEDILFNTIQRYHESRPWGSFLDAGTGVHSLKWIQTLGTDSWTAITADQKMKQQIVNDGSVILRSQDRLLVGNWMDEAFCQHLGKFDTILADYLIGAVDGFSPYEQDTIINKLSQHLNPNGRLYVIGMNPIPDHASGPAEVITEVRRARDACIQLAGHRPYREFPLTWMERHLSLASFSVTHSTTFSINHSEDSVLRQIKVAQSKLPLFPSLALREGMEEYLSELTERVRGAMRSSQNNRISLSSDYVISAELVMTSNHSSTTLLHPPFPPSVSSSEPSIESSSSSSSARSESEF